MSKSRSSLANYAVYLVVRLLVCVIQALSFEVSCALARGLAWLVYQLDRRHRQVAHDNLRYAFPDQMSDAQRDSVVRAVYVHFCTMLIEIIHAPRRLHLHNWRRHLTLRGGQQLVSGLLSGRPLLLVTAHFGNWELGGYLLGLLGFATHAVARPLDNPYVDAYLRQFRQRTGQKLLAKKGDFDQMQALLAKGGVIATLGDQDAGERGLFVDFFGRPASTHKAIALLALEYQVPLVVLGTRRRDAPLCFEVVVEELILPEEYQGQPNAVRMMTQRFTAALERLIRTAPEQYFWLHRRWKHQPTRARRRAA
jgi:KDO2-lipid IV(A) lauroyltransferase